MKGTKKAGISRRDLLRIGGLAAVGAVGAGALSGCAPKAGSSKGDVTNAASMLDPAVSGHHPEALPGFLAELDPIAESNIKATKEFDIVVIGAGAAGVTCALSAVENGASVAVLQKESMVI
ncbi:MAG: FAD-binding protein, partial [Gordonibacter sp.]|uniref:FAD-binding protein n=1 Tax=Gordonibacter sp. TaxID=1968902 RepID=UPI002FCC12E6